MSKLRPYWFPELTDADWVARIRDDYPEDTAEMDDDDIRERYADGMKYADTWDHVRDARESYEQLADAFLGLLEAATAILSHNDAHDDTDEEATLRAAIAKATGEAP